MTTDEDAQPSHSTEEASENSDDEPQATETTRLLLENDRVGTNAAEDVNNPAEYPEQARRFSISNWTKRDIGYGLLFSVPLLLFVPSLVLFIVTLNLRATLPPSSSLETITNLTHRVSHLSKSLSTCQDNTTHLTIMLHDEQQRVQVCRESEKRLAARVDLAEEMLDRCQSEERVLKEQLADVRGNLGTCVDEREELKRQMESGVFVQFLDMVSKMGSGGDSWVCSDTTPSWTFGYASDESPHPTIKIHSWTADLDDARYSAIPLVFPPPSSSSKVSQPAPPSPSGPSSLKETTPLGRYSQTRIKPVSTRPSSTYAKRVNQSFRVIGYAIKSLNISGNNGWWRITKYPSFGVEGSSIEFFALAAKWMGSKAKYEVTVYWVGNDDCDVDCV